MNDTPPPIPAYGPPPPPPLVKKQHIGKSIAFWCSAAALGVLIGGGAALLTKNDDRGTKNQVANEPATSAPNDEPTVSEECQAWVKEELKDPSQAINAESGYAACGDLSDKQWDTVFDDATEEISDDPSALKEATSTQAEKFQDCVAETGTATEKVAVQRVTKVTGTDEQNNILDTADVFTDYSGGMFGPHHGEGKLIASAFASCYKSDNGLVTVYDKDGEMLANSRY